MPKDNTSWECSGNPPKYREHPLVENHGDSCIICERSRFDTEQRATASQLTEKVIVAVLVAAILGIGGWLAWSQIGEKVIGIIQPSNGNNDSSSPTSTPNPIAPPVLPSESERFSSGERRLLSDKPNANVVRGTEAFAKANYDEARDLLTRAVNDDPQDPEAQIYLNNAEARLAGSPVVLAVVVPIHGALDSAKEMLRGVADAQTEFNKRGGLNGRLLEMVIADDDSNPDVSSSVAEKLTNAPEILGVIGHDTSDDSRAAIPKYEQGGLAMISPTSTGTDLSSDIFFRTVPSNKIAGKRLAQYSTAKGLKRVAVFYTPQSSYSNSLEQAFEDEFSGEIVKFDISSSQLNAEDAVKNLQGQVEAIVLFPSKNLLTIALGIARANEQLPDGQQLQLLGGDILYDPTTLTSGGNAVENLIIAVPWFAQTDYANRAENRWKGRVSWRTATSYDAALAFVNALSSNPSRQSILNNLKSVSLPASETSGEALRFSSEGERVGDPILVQAVRGGGGPLNSQFAFQPIQ